MKAQNKSMMYYIFLIFLFLLTFLNIASVEIGNTMILATIPPMIFLLIPVLFIETIIYWLTLNMSIMEAIFISFTTNLFSTMYGILFLLLLPFGLPLLFVFLLIGDPFSDYILNLPLIGPLLGSIYGYSWRGASSELSSETILNLYPLLPILLTLYSIATGLIKFNIIKTMYKNIIDDKLQKSVWITNLATYAFLMVCLLLFLPLKSNNTKIFHDLFNYLFGQTKLLPLDFIYIICFLIVGFVILWEIIQKKKYLNNK